MQINIRELLEGQLSGGAVEQVSQAIGADEQSTSTAISAALPLLLGGMARNAQSPEGAESLSAALNRDHDGSVLDNLMGYLGGGGDANNGLGILGHVFGGSQQNAAQGVSRVSGINMAQAMQLMAILAPIVMGVLGRTQRQQALDPGGLAGVLGQSTRTADGGDLMGVLSQVLDRNRDGSSMDDIAGLLGGIMGGRR
jgi:hypothetical protein